MAENSTPLRKSHELDGSRELNVDGAAKVDQNISNESFDDFATPYDATAFFPDLLGLDNRRTLKDPSSPMSTLEQSIDEQPSLSPTLQSEDIRNQLQGILWKRRDVFKNRWLPRYFILSPSKAALNYFLLPKSLRSHEQLAARTQAVGSFDALSNNKCGNEQQQTLANGCEKQMAVKESDIASNASYGSTTVPGVSLDNLAKASENMFDNFIRKPIKTVLDDAKKPLNLLPHSHAKQQCNSNSETPSSSRPRSSSWDGSITANNKQSDHILPDDSITDPSVIDYSNICPRGTILLTNCIVYANDELSRPEEDMFVFTIQSPNVAHFTNPANVVNAALHSKQPNLTTGTFTRECHLAARTVEIRNEWVQHLQQVCIRTSATGVVSHQYDGNSPLPAGSVDETPASSSEWEPLLESDGYGTFSSPGVDPYCWHSIDSPDSIYKNVPEPLASQIQTRLHRHLQSFFGADDDDDSDDAAMTVNGESSRLLGRITGWIPLHSDVHRKSSAYQRVMADGGIIIRSHCIFPRHSPQTVLRVLLDTKRRQNFENNIRTAERLHVYNAHNFLDYVAYHPVWPTTARDFAAVLHWEVVQRHRKMKDPTRNHTHDRGIVVYGFSCNEANSVKPPLPDHVRGYLRLTMTLLRPNLNAEGKGCHMTRIISFDLGGSISQGLTNIVVSQQSRVPAVINQYMDRSKELSNPHEEEPLSNTTLAADVSRHLSLTLSKICRDPGKSNRTNELETSDTNSRKMNCSLPAEKRINQPHLPPNIFLVALVLLLPVLIHRLFVTWQKATPSLLFLFLAFSSIRIVVLLSLRRHVLKNAILPDIDVITCQVKVDLAGILRFIDHVNTEIKRRNGESMEATIAFAVASAVCFSLAQNPLMRLQKVSIPLLMIEEIILPESHPVNVLILEGHEIVSFEGVRQWSAADVASSLTRAKRGIDATARNVDGALVIALTDVVEASCYAKDEAVTVFIGGVNHEIISGGTSTPSMLSVNISIRILCPSTLELIPSFIQDFHKRLQCTERLE
jgi:hypothetical protein